jgi:hypothetical protein
VDASGIAGYKPMNDGLDTSSQLDPWRQENPMETGRRYFLLNFAVILAGVNTLWAGGQQQRQLPPPLPSQFPDASRGSGRAGEEVPPPPIGDPKVQLKESQKNLRRDADRLLQLVNELKDEAYKTEQTDVLSLSLIHKAEEVEKLAKQIKDLVRVAWKHDFNIAPFPAREMPVCLEKFDPRDKRICEPTTLDGNPTPIDLQVEVTFRVGLIFQSFVCGWGQIT